MIDDDKIGVIGGGLGIRWCVAAWFPRGKSLIFTNFLSEYVANMWLFVRSGSRKSDGPFNHRGE